METLTKAFGGGVLAGGWTVESLQSPEASKLVARTRGAPLTDDAFDRLTDMIANYYKRPDVKRLIRRHFCVARFPLEPELAVSPFGCTFMVNPEDRAEMLAAVAELVGDETCHTLDRLGL